MAKAKTVPFRSIKIGKFFRRPGRGRALWQKFDDTTSQCVNGKCIGGCVAMEGSMVVPVNANIVEKKGQ